MFNGLASDWLPSKLILARDRSGSIRSDPPTLLAAVAHQVICCYRYNMTRSTQAPPRLMWSL